MIIIALFWSAPIAWFIVWWLLRLLEKSDSISKMNYWILLISLWIVLSIAGVYLQIGIDTLRHIESNVESCQNCRR